MEEQRCKPGVEWSSWVLAPRAARSRRPRRQLLKIDPAQPWASVITTAHDRLAAPPEP